MSTTLRVMWALGRFTSLRNAGVANAPPSMEEEEEDDDDEEGGRGGGG